MLDVLRKRASSAIVKILLGGIAIVFIFFFGSTTMRNPEVEGEIAAKVNGRPITGREVEGRLRMNLENNPYYKDLPETYRPQLRQGAVSELIQTAILEEEAKKMGLSVTDGEVALAIRKDENLGKDGKFDSVFYREKFRPGYANRYGIDFEAALREQLLIEKLRDLFLGTVTVSEEALKNRYAQKNTRVSIKKISLTEEQALKLWPSFQKGKLKEQDLKETGSKEEEVPITSLENANSLIEGGTPEIYAQIFSLTEKNPYPLAPIKAGDKSYLVKLTKKEEPDWEAFEKGKDEERKEMKEELAGEFLGKWYQQAAAKAKVKIFDRPKT